MKKKYLGSSGDHLATLAERAQAAYEQGCNSLFVRRNGSFHDAEGLFYAQRRTTGRRVLNPAAWLARAHRNEVGRDIALIALSRRG